jgi:hypothetical protein
MSVELIASQVIGHQWWPGYHILNTDEDNCHSEFEPVFVNSGGMLP